jgi:alkylation response protein AidB-like acyl-CoA dehydrogenase
VTLELDDAVAAGQLAKQIASGTADLRDGLTAAGLLDPDLPALAAVEVGYEIGYAGLARAVEVLDAAGDEPRLAAALAGAGQALLDVGMAYAREREVFGRAVSRFQVQRHAFALATGRVEAARELARRVASAGPAASAAERANAVPAAADAAWLAAETALQVHGGYGYTDEYPVSTMWREVVAVRSHLGV